MDYVTMRKQEAVSYIQEDYGRFLISVRQEDFSITGRAFRARMRLWREES